jgi:PEP-CTERM motif
MLKLIILSLMLMLRLVTGTVQAAVINVLVNNEGANNLTVVLPQGDLVLLESCPGGTMQDANGNTICTAAGDKVAGNFSDLVQFRTAAGVNNGNTVATLFSDLEQAFPTPITQTVYILENGTLGFPGGANSGFTKYTFVSTDTFNIYVNSDSPNNESDVPEPSSLPLVTIGLASLVYKLHRK